MTPSRPPGWSSCASARDPMGILARGVRLRACLEADRVDPAGDAQQRVLATVGAAGARTGGPAVSEDLLHGVAGHEVDRLEAHLPRLVEPIRDAVHDVDVGRASQACAHRREQADRSRSEDGHAVARGHAGELGCVVAGGQRVGEQDEVVLPVVSRLARQPQAVGVAERNADELGLRPGVATHARIAVRRARRAGVVGQALRAAS